MRRLFIVALILPLVACTVTATGGEVTKKERKAGYFVTKTTMVGNTPVTEQKWVPPCNEVSFRDSAGRTGKKCIDLKTFESLSIGESFNVTINK